MVKTNIDISFIWQYRNYLANELVDLSFIYLEFKLREKCWFWEKIAFWRLNAIFLHLFTQYSCARQA